jgi:hypothetical protein
VAADSRQKSDTAASSPWNVSLGSGYVPGGGLPTSPAVQRVTFGLGRNGTQPSIPVPTMRTYTLHDLRRLHAPLPGRGAEHVGVAVGEVVELDEPRRGRDDGAHDAPALDAGGALHHLDLAHDVGAARRLRRDRPGGPGRSCFGYGQPW